MTDSPERRYQVSVDFEVGAPLPTGTLGERVSQFEALLPGASAVHLVKEPVNKEDNLEIEVVLNAGSPALALRDVARAIEVVSHTFAGTLGEVHRATVALVGDAVPE